MKVTKECIVRARVSDDVYGWLLFYCREVGTTVSEVVRQSVATVASVGREMYEAREARQSQEVRHD